MQHQNFLSMSGNLFTFSSYACECRVDVNHTSDGKERKTLRIRAQKDLPLRFAYVPQEGIVKLNVKTGTKISNHLIDQLLSLPDNDINKTIEFFEEYGFFIPISTDEFEAFKFDDIFLVLRRMRAIVKLITMLQAPQKDYKIILALYIFLVFAPQVKIYSKSNIGAKFESCIHNVQQLISTAEGIRENEAFLHTAPNGDIINNYYDIPDTIRTSSFHMSYIDYHEIVTHPNWELIPKDNECVAYRPIVKLYKNCHNIPIELRKQIDFLYHFQENISIIKSVGTNSQILFHRDIDGYYNNFFDKDMKVALLDAAKQAVKEEINHALYSVTPDYNVDTMSASWYIPDFIAALYFSVFYMRSNMEIYRKCSNPSCENYFRVNTTNNKRKYCCPQCANTTAQRMHRKKKQQIQ